MVNGLADFINANTKKPCLCLRYADLQTQLVKITDQKK